MADVFLSFRGEVRNNFACVLCEALKTAGFQPFMDEADVLPGDELTPTIYEAIANCKSAIIIFSKDYPSSKWCLNELVLLLERRENSKTFFIIPILHGLKTVDIKIRFCKEIEMHKPKVDDLQIEKWKEALVKIADTKSKHFREIDMVTDFAAGIALRFKEIFISMHTLPSPEAVDTSKRPIKGNSAPKIDVSVDGLIVKEVSDFVESETSFKSNRKPLEGTMRTTASSNISSSSTQYSDIGELPDFVVGLDFQLQKLKEILLNNTVSVTPENVVLLSAPPGCGKTTLATMVCHDSEIREKFKENIFFVTVSKTFNIKVIVKKIFEHKGRENELREVQSDEDAIKKLRNLLKRLGGPDQNPMLLVLDDVWSSNLKYLVDKFMFKEIPGYKILVTSRYHHPGFQFFVKLEMLDHKEATNLFCHHAFPEFISTQTRVSDGDVDEIVKGCMGFPLALKVVAKSLCGKDEVFWKSTLNKWSERKYSIIDSIPDLLEMLEKSFDALDDEKDTDTVLLKECFLDLGSFPEDQRIPGTALMDMWAELYGLDEEDMNTYSILYELSCRNLVDRVPTRKDGSSDYCSGRYVKQHDMLRELAIYRSSQEEIEIRKRFIMEIGEKGFPKKLVENLEKPRKARLLTISTDDSFTSTWCDMQFHEVEVLILNFRQRNYTLPNPFMKHMKKLKVLIVTNYSFHPAQVQNFPEIECLSSLRRMRLEHVSISSNLSTTTFALPLQKLKKISLIMCEISKALDNFAHLFPNLEEIEIELCRDLLELPAGLCHIINLRRISITSCNELRALPEEIESLTNLQSLRLNSCTKLKGLPEKIASLKNLNLIDVSDCIQLCTMPIRMGELKSLKKLHMRGCSGLSELPPSVEKLKNLEVFCDKPAAPLWQSYTNVKVNLVKEDINLEWLHI